MIISASRRTDIPAFYSQWFMNRLQEGYCLVPNPFNPRQVARISLVPESVDAIVFWSKNPAPMLRFLPKLEGMGYRYYFLFTVNDYPCALEPTLPPVEQRIATFIELSRMIGPRRVIWRYDPIILSNKTDFSYHRKTFDALCRQLTGHTQRVITSIITLYRKTLRNLAPLEEQGYVFDKEPRANAGTEALLSHMAASASEHGLEIFACAEPGDYTHLGIRPSRCIDAALIRELWGIPVSSKKDPGQREHCGCALSRDIGMTDTCAHGCPYCYSTVNPEIAVTRNKIHDPCSTALIGSPEPSEKDPKEIRRHLI
jgi:DNA repair photolyase